MGCCLAGWLRAVREKLRKKNNVKIAEFVVCICIKHFVYFFVIVVINPEKKMTYIPFLVADLG